MKKVWGWLAFQNIVWALIAAIGIQLGPVAFITCAILNIVFMVIEKD